MADDLMDFDANPHVRFEDCLLSHTAKPDPFLKLASVGLYHFVKLKHLEDYMKFKQTDANDQVNVKELLQKYLLDEELCNTFNEEQRDQILGMTLERLHSR